MAVLLLWAGLAFAVDEINLKVEQSTDYLPYRAEIENHLFCDVEASPVIHSRHIIRVSQIDGPSGSWVYAKNQSPWVNSFSHLLRMEVPSGVIMQEHPVKELILSDLAVTIDSQLQDTSVLISGFWHDSAYICKWTLATDSLERIFVATGPDKNGNGSWDGQFIYQHTSDYDQDGRVESFFYLNTERDLEPRLLVCIQSSPFKIEWTLQMASMVVWVIPIRDSLCSGVLVSTHCPGQGAVDSLFTDSFGYLVRIDTSGKVQYHHKISQYPEGTRMIRGRANEDIYLAHGFEFDKPPDSADSAPLGTGLSRVAFDGSVLNQESDSAGHTSIWLADWDGDTDDELFVTLRDGRIRVFESDLTSAAIISSREIQSHVSSLPAFDGHSDAQVINEADGHSGIFDNRLTKLASLPQQYQYVEVAERGVNGEATLLMCAGYIGESHLIRIQRQSWLTLVAIFYRDNQVYVLATLFSALFGLMVSNYYRRKTKQNLATIRSQKIELEETHEALKRAQETIIAQEKYRQAKDIAGGFAHEIRNALFPADSSLTQVNQMTMTGSVDPAKVSKHIRLISSAVSRAIGITQLITQYTKLESERIPEQVDLPGAVRAAFAAHRQMLDQQGVIVSVSGPDSLAVLSNNTQLGMVLNNLILNSLDALTNRPKPTILVRWERLESTASVTFSDNGCGIAADDLHRVFDTFFSTKPSHGTGLGLATTKRIVELYGGGISVSSEPGSGTTFTIRFCLFSQE
ncbi:MAG: HAMP domain-containing histidine kinase [bacterium]|nr:HAMP domain-containing histidine kinase [bacterium]